MAWLTCLSCLSSEQCLDEVQSEELLECFLADSYRGTSKDFVNLLTGQPQAKHTLLTEVGVTPYLPAVYTYFNENDCNFHLQVMRFYRNERVYLLKSIRQVIVSKLGNYDNEFVSLATDLLDPSLLTTSWKLFTEAVTSDLPRRPTLVCTLCVNSH